MQKPVSGSFPCFGFLPASGPERLGDAAFRAVHGLQYAYIGGGMARGIGSAALVECLARNGMMGFFGSAGLDLERVEAELRSLVERLGAGCPNWGVNLIHTPQRPELEERMVDLLLAHGVGRVEAAAFMGLTPALVRLASRGLHRDEGGGVRRRTHIFAKVSRAEVARHFLAPAPRWILDELVEKRALTKEEAELASLVPVAHAITVEADSAGHTDHRPLGPAFSSIHDQARRMDAPVFIGVAGGLGTPHALASAFALGADYVCVGSVHQACLESGTSMAVKEMLAGVTIADVAMTSAADMFERGIKVQVLRRGTMMPQRGNYLYNLYLRHASIEDIPEEDRANLEKSFFRQSLQEVWRETEAYFERADPEQLPLARRDGKLKMALLFRWYLGKTSQWAISGEPERRLDYQVWCGPAMGAFNDWARGSFLEHPAERGVATVALNLLEGASRLTRAHHLRTLGFPVPASAFHYRPCSLDQLREKCNGKE